MQSSRHGRIRKALQLLLSFLLGESQAPQRLKTCLATLTPMYRAQEAQAVRSQRRCRDELPEDSSSGFHSRAVLVASAASLCPNCESLRFYRQKNAIFQFPLGTRGSAKIW